MGKTLLGHNAEFLDQADDDGSFYGIIIWVQGQTSK